MKKVKRLNRVTPFTVFNYTFFIILTLVAVIPIYLIAANAFSTNADILEEGYAVVPKNFTFEAFQYLFKAPETLINSLVGSIVYSVGSSVIAIIIQALMGYVLTRPEFCLKKFCKAVLIASMFFSPGLIPSYIVNTQVYHLENTWTIYLLSGLVSAFNVFVFRTFFQQIPSSLVESAEMDGCTPVQILWNIIIPLSKPILATQLFMGISGKWRDYSVTLYYITDKTKYTLEYYIQLLMKDSAELVNALKLMGADPSAIPTETMKFAVVFFVLIPMLVIFPFFQKQFSKGAMVGAVKG